MKQRDRITISEASRVLSVSEQALRQWTDEGKIKAFITPGGHRRYSLAELKRFVNQNRKTLGTKDLVADLEHIVPVLHDTAINYLSTTAWHGQMDSESQSYMASLGRHLLELIIKSISETSWQFETLEEIRDVGANFGRILAQQGFSLDDALKTYLQHRNPIIRVVTDMLKKREGFSQRIVEAIPIVNNAIDEAMISLVTAYQQRQRAMRKKNGSKQA